MELIKNKITNEIVYISDKKIDLLSVFKINLIRNFPNVSINAYEVFQENDPNIIQQINNSSKIKLNNGNYEFEQNFSQPIYSIDKIAQLQCQIEYLQKQIDDLKQK